VFFGKVSEKPSKKKPVEKPSEEKPFQKPSEEFAGGQFARHSPSRAQYEDGTSRSFEMERRNGPRLPFMVFVLLLLERVGSLIVVTMMVSVEVALIGGMFWIVLTPHWSKWPSTGFTLLVLTLVLSCLFAHVLGFCKESDAR
jgi:hypothetical protein